MQASPIKLLGLLEDTKTVFKVPVYQRKYEWGKEQLEKYFLDIERIINSDFKKRHFLGTVVYVQNELPGLMKERVIIDGQQRITSTLILLKAIMDISKELDSKDINWMEIRDTYLINPYGRGDTEYKLMPVDKDREAYKELMNDNKTNSIIYSNYNACKIFIEKSKFDIKSIYEALGNIDVVYIALDLSEDPQIIFESLNSTGLSLTESDLIRNFILMGLDYTKQSSLYNNYWRKIESILPNKIISEFIRDFITMKQGIVPNKNKVYDAFKVYFFENKYSPERILEELLKYSSYYGNIINSSTEDVEVNNILNYINIIKNTVSYPYLLKLFNDYYFNKLIKKDEFLDILRIMTSYVYRRSICNMPSNSLNKIFSKMPSEIDKKIENGMGYVDSVIDYLMSRSGTGIFPRDEEFKKNFLNNDLYSKSNRLAKILLHVLEKGIHKEVVNLESLSVEHILPQTLTNEWNIELGKKAHEVHMLYKNTIGNLTLTNYNSEISNKSFDEKKKYYNESNIKITRDINKYEKWTDKEILDRADKLFKIIKKIWNIPKDKYSTISDERLLPEEEYSIKENILVTGYTPKKIIIDEESFLVRSWKEMLMTTCKYLYNLDSDLFVSLKNNPRFKKFISYKKENLRSPKKVNGLYVETNHNAKDTLSYIVLLFEEYKIEDIVYFQIK